MDGSTDDVHAEDEEDDEEDEDEDEDEVSIADDDEDYIPLTPEEEAELAVRTCFLQLLW